MTIQWARISNRLLGVPMYHGHDPRMINARNIQCRAVICGHLKRLSCQQAVRLYRDDAPELQPWMLVH